MGNNRGHINSIDDMLFLLVEDKLNPEGAECFERWLSSAPGAKKHYCEFINDYTAMRYKINSMVGVDEEKFSVSDEFDLELWSTLAEIEEKAEGVEICKQEPERKLIEKVDRPKVAHDASKFKLSASLLGAAAVLLLVLLIRLAPDNSTSVEVATLSDQIDAKWGDWGLKPKTGQRLWTNKDLLWLTKGVANIRYDNGVDVVIEGPAMFELERSGIYLEYGRLYSRVSELGLGFRVETPSSQFVDMGTEFGIQAGVDGSSEVHVIKGKVQLFAGSAGNSKTSKMVTENMAVQYDANSNKVKNVQVEENAFVRQINSDMRTVWRGQKIIDLADVVGGGDGFGSGKIGYGISVDNTRIEKFVGPERKALNSLSFNEINSHKLIDGVFLPDGGLGEVIISSSGHIFKECPDTTGGINRPILNGGDNVFYTEGEYAPQMIQGKIYGTKENPALYMTTNAGITFDLQKIKELLSDISFKAFKTESAFSSNVNINEADASVFVLVDGVVRYSNTELKIEPEYINIPLKPGDRFLTLISTDNGNQKNDWVLFGRPHLELE